MILSQLSLSDQPFLLTGRTFSRCFDLEHVVQVLLLPYCFLSIVQLLNLFLLPETFSIVGQISGPGRPAVTASTISSFLNLSSYSKCEAVCPTAKAGLKPGHAAGTVNDLKRMRKSAPEWLKS